MADNKEQTSKALDAARAAHAVTTEACRQALAKVLELEDLQAREQFDAASDTCLIIPGFGLLPTHNEDGSVADISIDHYNYNTGRSCVTIRHDHSSFQLDIAKADIAVMERKIAAIRDLEPRYAFPWYEQRVQREKDAREAAREEVLAWKFMNLVVAVVSVTLGKWLS